MENLLANIGIISIVLLIAYISIKIKDYYYTKRLNRFREYLLYEIDDTALDAARSFAHGSSNEEVKGLLVASINFDEDDADEIISVAAKHKSDDDGGYIVFIKTMNRISNKVYI